MTSFRIAFHSATGRRCVEVFDDHGQFVAAIYPTDDGSNRIHIVSNYFADDPIAPSSGDVPVPGYLVKFKAKP
jgi:hypothetical protein